MNGPEESPKVVPYQHCALCPVAALPQLALLPEVARLSVHPLAPHSAATTSIEPLALAKGATPPWAEALLVCWSADPSLEAGLAALDGIRFFDWCENRYRERRTRSTITPTAPGSDDQHRDFHGTSTSRQPHPAGPLHGELPQPLRLEFADFTGWVECQAGPAQALSERLRLAPVKATGEISARGRVSGAFSTGRSTRVMSGALQTPAAGTRMPSPAGGVPIAAAGNLVGLRVAPAGPVTSEGASQAVLLSGAQRSDLLAWMGNAPPNRWEGLLFAIFADGVWIDRLTPGAPDLPPLLEAERLTAHTGAMGSTLWLQSGAAWTPPLAADLLLERLAAQPACDYILQVEPSGSLRCRYVLDRTRLLPLTRATVRAALAPQERV